MFCLNDGQTLGDALAWAEMMVGMLPFTVQ